jgi:hypothetical protein
MKSTFAFFVALAFFAIQNIAQAQTNTGTASPTVFTMATCTGSESGVSIKLRVYAIQDSSGQPVVKVDYQSGASPLATYDVEFDNQNSSPTQLAFLMGVTKDGNFSSNIEVTIPKGQNTTGTMTVFPGGNGQTQLSCNANW